MSTPPGWLITRKWASQLFYEGGNAFITVVSLQGHTVYLQNINFIPNENMTIITTWTRAAICVSTQQREEAERNYQSSYHDGAYADASGEVGDTMHHTSANTHIICQSHTLSYRTEPVQTRRLSQSKYQCLVLSSHSAKHNQTVCW